MRKFPGLLFIQFRVVVRASHRHHGRQSSHIYQDSEVGTDTHKLPRSFVSQDWSYKGLPIRMAEYTEASLLAVSLVSLVCGGSRRMIRTCSACHRRIFSSTGLVGRGAVCYLSRRASGGQEFVIKDYWVLGDVDDADVLDETTMMEAMEGIPGVRIVRQREE
jgi:hypothetical protein